MSVGGMIQLSFRQAEGRRFRGAVLCLKYLASLALALAAVFLWIKAEGTPARTGYAALSAAASVAAVFGRGAVIRAAYLASSRYLRVGGSQTASADGFLRLLCGEAAYLAACAAVTAAALSPSYICLRAGIRYYRLSSERGHFMLLLAASLLLAAGGMIFACVIRTRLGCAEYLWLSGRTNSMLDALDASWELTRGNSGDFIRLRFLSFFFGASVSALCRMNYTEHLLRNASTPSEKEIYVELVCNPQGEQHLELL